MAKKPRSFSISERNLELLEHSNVNASQVVDQFLDQYFAVGASDTSAVEQRIAELDDEISNLEKQLERKKRRRERLAQQQVETEKQLHESVCEVAQEFADRPELIDADHAAVKRLSAQYDMTADQIAGRIQEQMP